MPAPIILVNAVGMTTRLLPHAPRMKRWAEQGWVRPLREVLPAVTSTAQATILTGKNAEGHGIVANGWLFRDTMEVRFWQQSNHLLQAEPLYVTAKRRAQERGRSFRCAKLFWWFNQGAAVDFSVTPKPYYGADGNKAFGITGKPLDLSLKLERALAFPFPSFWGPKAGLPSTQWIARCAAVVLRDHLPDLTLVYLPHLDYDPQRHGPSSTDMAKCVKELDDAFAAIDYAARLNGARVWIVSEYGHVDVQTPVFPNRTLRQAGLLTVRAGPFGEMLETFESDAFAVCDHQLAHVYVREPSLLPRVQEVLSALPGVARMYAGEERRDIGLNHPRAGDIVLLSKPDAWFAYPYWLDDGVAPDFARTVDIHRKPGFDPCELFFDPKLTWSTGRVMRRLLQKKLGFRTLFDVIPLDANLVRGSHGLQAASVEDRPVLIGDGTAPSAGEVSMTGVRDLVLEAMGLEE
jgi:predicted AlkP superfamily pyrophosphatase or phosphodiesterase